MTVRSRDTDPFAPLADSYEAWFETPLGGFIDRLELEALDAVLPGPGEGVVVEVGAGTGHVARHLVSRGYRVLGLEPSAAMLTAGLRQEDGVEWCRGVGEQLPLRDESIDGLLIFATLEFVSDPARVLSEALRAVRPGGWLAVGLLHAHSGWVALYRSLAEEGEEPWNAATFFAPEAVEKLVGLPLAQSAGAAYLGPNPEPPFDEAEAAGRRAGNAPALQLLLWRKAS